MAHKNFGENDFTLGQAKKVMERHGIPVKSAFHGVGSFDVADALLTLEKTQADLLEALTRLVAADNCNYDREAMRHCGYFDAARAAIRKATQQKEGDRA
jgi:hypothetical protein